MNKKILATIISSKMTNTVVVGVSRVIKHPKYHKILRRTTKLFAHNDLGPIAVGAEVYLVATKPFSKNTNFKVVEIKK